MPETIAEQLEAYIKQTKPLFADRLIVTEFPQGTELTFVSPDGLGGASKSYSGEEGLAEAKGDVDAFRG